MYGLQEDQEVEGHRAVLDVVEVVAHLPGGAEAASRVATADLGPPGQAGLHERAALVVGDQARQLVDELGRLRAGADEAHLALEDLPELGQLVEMGLAQD